MEDPESAAAIRADVFLRGIWIGAIPIVAVALPLPTYSAPPPVEEP